eukprot:2790755-Amphidinium_carterae.1
MVVATTTDVWRSSTPGPPEYDQNFYEMPFHLVNPSLVAGRRVVLRNGKAGLETFQLVTFRWFHAEKP